MPCSTRQLRPPGSYLGEEDWRCEDDGEAPDEDETPAAVGHRAQRPGPHRKYDHDEPGTRFVSRSPPCLNEAVSNVNTMLDGVTYPG